MASCFDRSDEIACFAAFSICVLLSKLILSLTLKRSRGKSRKSRATFSSATTVGSKSPRGGSTMPPGRVSIACTAPSSWSIRDRLGRERLAMCTLHLRSQLLQRTKLQLLHRSFAFSKLLRNFPNASLLNKSTKDYASLVIRKFLYQS